MPATQLTRRIQGGSVLIHTTPQPPLAPLPRPAWVPLSDGERELARKDAAASLARSRLRIEAWLSAPCPKHHAKSGERCIPFVGGICRERIEASRA